MEQEISLYRPVFKNAVYSRSRTVGSGNGPLPLQEILVPRRYTEATEDAVVGYLRKIARENLSVPIIALPGGRCAVPGDKTKLEIAVAKLPGTVKGDLIEGNLDCLEFVRRNTRARALREGEEPLTYLDVLFGLLPEELVVEHQKRGEVQDPKWYITPFLMKK